MKIQIGVLVGKNSAEENTKMFLNRFLCLGWFVHRVPRMLQML